MLLLGCGDFVCIKQTLTTTIKQALTTARNASHKDSIKYSIASDFDYEAEDTLSYRKLEDIEAVVVDLALSPEGSSLR
jgi:uncharacterized protein YdaL